MRHQPHQDINLKAVTGEITYSRPTGVPRKGVSIISVHDGKYKVEEVWFPQQ